MPFSSLILAAFALLLIVIVLRVALPWDKWRAVKRRRYWAALKRREGEAMKTWGGEPFRRGGKPR